MFSGWSRISTSFDFNPDEKETKLFKLHDKGGIADGKYLDVMQVNEVILSYPWLFKPRAPQQRQDGSMSESRYTAQFIMPIETHRDAIVQIKSQISRFAKVCVGQEMPLDRTCLRDGRQQMDRPEVQQAFYVNTATGIAPQRRAFSSMRPPKTPLLAITTLSPGSSRLTNAHSIPAEPGAEIGRVTAFWV